MGLQRRPVIVDAIEHHRGDRERPCPAALKTPLGQDVVDQAAVHAAIAVLERVDVHEPKRGRRRFSNWVKARLRACGRWLSSRPAMRSLRSPGRAPMNSGSGSPLWSRSPQKHAVGPVDPHGRKRMSRSGPAEGG